METNFDHELSSQPCREADAERLEPTGGQTLTTNRERPIGVDLFSGAGGLSLGFEQAGFDIRAAVDIDPVHCATYAYNFPQTSVICASVKDLTGHEIRERAGLGDLAVDCVFGGAPSQGFTTMGARAADDPRNALVGDFFRLVYELSPRAFVFDNVKGITLGAHRQWLFRQMAMLELTGYEIRTGLKILNAAHFGVPQSREHFFLMGVRYGEKLPQYPNLKGSASICVAHYPENGKIQEG